MVADVVVLAVEPVFFLRGELIPQVVELLGILGQRLGQRILNLRPIVMRSGRDRLAPSAILIAAASSESTALASAKISSSLGCSCSSAMRASIGKTLECRTRHNRVGDRVDRHVQRGGIGP